MACGALVAVTVVHSAIAQSSVSAATANRDRVVTAAENARDILLYRAISDLDQATEYRRPTELDTVLSQRAQVWVGALQTQPVKGLQMDPLGELYVVAGHDAQAKQQFAARLATRGLSLMDRAYTLALAVRTFSAKASDTVRVRIASDYMQQLDALPNDAARFQYNAHVSLADANYLMGNSAAAIAHVLHAFSRIPHIPFLSRNQPAFEFTLFADAMSGQKDGRRIIDSVANRLLTLYEAPPELVAIDSIYYRHGYDLQQDFKRTLQSTNYLGRPAPAITAQYWWNTTTPTEASSLAPGAMIKRLDDGKARLIELGSITCMWCMKALPDLEKIHVSLPPNAEAWYVTRGYGIWGVEPCPPDTEAKRLNFLYLTQKKHTLPIALWIGPRVADDDGGSLVQNNPMWELFGFEGGPVFLVTDGHGIVRHVSVGASKGLEPQQRALRFVIAEAARAVSASSRSSR